MYEKQTNKQTILKRILEQQVRLSEGSPAVCVFPATCHFLDGIPIERC